MGIVFDQIIQYQTSSLPAAGEPYLSVSHLLRAIWECDQQLSCSIPSTCDEDTNRFVVGSNEEFLSNEPKDFNGYVVLEPLGDTPEGSANTGQFWRIDILAWVYHWDEASAKALSCRWWDLIRKQACGQQIFCMGSVCRAGRNSLPKSGTTKLGKQAFRTQFVIRVWEQYNCTAVDICDN